MGMDGSVTPRAEMASKLARWTNAHADIWKSRPVKGDVGIVFVQEADDFNSVQSGARQLEAAARRPRRGRGGGGMAAGAYVQSLQGAYQAFFDSNIQADFVGIDDIGGVSDDLSRFPRDAQEIHGGQDARLCREGRQVDQ